MEYFFTDDDGYVLIDEITISSPSPDFDLPTYTYHPFCTSMSKKMSATCEAGSAYLSGAPVVGVVRIAKFLDLFVFSCTVIVSVFFSFLAMAFSVYFRLMSFNLPLVSLASFLLSK